MSLKLDANKFANAFQDWMASSISKIDAERQSVGKFLFTVSSGSIGILAAIVEFADVDADQFMIAAIFFFVSASICAVALVLPDKSDVFSNTDLQALHEKLVDKVRLLARGWTFLWVIGLIFGFLGLWS